MSSKKRSKAIKFVEGLKNSTDPKFEGQPFDVIIPVMGSTGVGKSTFINSLLEPSQIQAKVGNGLASCTSHLTAFVIPFGPRHKNPYNNSTARLVLVDTPGFDDTYIDDMEILRRISVWLALSYVKDMKLGGVIYLHDITETRMVGNSRKHLLAFQNMVGENALECVVIGTTKWRSIDLAVGVKREEQLKSDGWKAMISAGTPVVRVTHQGSSCEIVNRILNRLNSKVEILQIQSELVHLQRYIPETLAGRTLMGLLDESNPLKKAKVPKESWGTRIKKLFH